MLLPISIDKRILWKYVNKKFKGVIHYYHVLAVIDILFEEIIKDLRHNKEIPIFNFGILSLKQMKPRLYHNVKYGQVMYSQGNKILRFTLSPKIKKKLIKNINTEATLKVK